MQLRIWIPAILLVISTTYSIQHYYGVFNYYNQFTAQEDIEKGSVQLLLYGEVDQDEEKTIEHLKMDYGVTIRRVTGKHQVEASKLNGFKRYNKVMVKHLSKTHGSTFIKELPFRFR